LPSHSLDRGSENRSRQAVSFASVLKAKPQPTHQALGYFIQETVEKTADLGIGRRPVAASMGVECLIEMTLWNC
jgi:hypothetical protein